MTERPDLDKAFAQAAAEFQQGLPPECRGLARYHDGDRWLWVRPSPFREGL